MAEVSLVFMVFWFSLVFVGTFGTLIKQGGEISLADNRLSSFDCSFTDPSNAEPHAG